MAATAVVSGGTAATAPATTPPASPGHGHASAAVTTSAAPSHGPRPLRLGHHPTPAGVTPTASAGDHGPSLASGSGSGTGHELLDMRGGGSPPGAPPLPSYEAAVSGAAGAGAPPLLPLTAASAASALATTPASLGLGGSVHRGQRRHLRLLVGLFVLMVGSAYMAYVSQDVMFTWLNRVGRSGVAGPVILALLFLPVSLPFLYGYSVLAVGGGFFFGVHVATLAVLCGSTTGAGLAFWLTRWFLHGFIQRRLGNYKIYKAIMRAVEKDAFKIVFLCRLVPIPFGMMNSILAVRRRTVRAKLTSAAAHGAQLLGGGCPGGRRRCRACASACTWSRRRWASCPRSCCSATLARRSGACRTWPRARRRWTWARLSL